MPAGAEQRGFRRHFELPRGQVQHRVASAHRPGGLQQRPQRIRLAARHGGEAVQQQGRRGGDEGVDAFLLQRQLPLQRGLQDLLRRGGLLLHLAERPSSSASRRSASPMPLRVQTKLATGASWPTSISTTERPGLGQVGRLDRQGEAEGAATLGQGDRRVDGDHAARRRR